MACSTQGRSRALKLSQTCSVEDRAALALITLLLMKYNLSGSLPARFDALKPSEGSGPNNHSEPKFQDFTALEASSNQRNKPSFSSYNITLAPCNYTQDIYYIEDTQDMQAFFFLLLDSQMLCFCLLPRHSAKFLQSTPTEGNYYLISSRSYFSKIHGIKIPLENRTGKGTAP